MKSSVLAGNIQSLIFIGNFQTQFSLTISKLSSHWQYLNPNSHWQYQNPILIGNIKVQFLLAIFKAQFSLTKSNPNFHWQYQSSIFIGNIKSPTYVSTILSKAQGY